MYGSVLMCVCVYVCMCQYMNPHQTPTFISPTASLLHTYACMYIHTLPHDIGHAVKSSRRAPTARFFAGLETHTYTDIHTCMHPAST